MINKAKEVINSKKVQTVVSAVSAIAELAGNTLVGFCKLVIDSVNKLKKN